MDNSATLNFPGQSKVSDRIRTNLKRYAAQNGGLRKLCQMLGFDYDRAWHQLNRGQGVLAEMLVITAAAGLDEPLRIVAHEAGYDVTPKQKFLRRAHPPTKPVRSYALDIHHACSSVTQMIEDALVDGSFDARERARVMSAIHSMRRELAELEQKVAGEQG